MRVSTLSTDISEEVIGEYLEHLLLADLEDSLKYS